MTELKILMTTNHTTTLTIITTDMLFPQRWGAQNCLQFPLSQKNLAGPLVITVNRIIKVLLAQLIVPTRTNPLVQRTRLLKVRPQTLGASFAPQLALVKV